MILLSILDQYLRLKARADWQKHPKTFGKLKLGYVENYGVFAGFLKEKPRKVMKFQAIFTVCCIFYTFYVILARKNSLTQIGWILCSIGGMNNLWDRAWNGFVTDYVSVGGKLYFNIADGLVFVGVTMALLGDLYATVSKPNRQIATDL